MIEVTGDEFTGMTSGQRFTPRTRPALVMFVHYCTHVPAPLSIVEARIAQTRALSTTRRRPR